MNEVHTGRADFYLRARLRTRETPTSGGGSLQEHCFGVEGLPKLLALERVRDHHRVTNPQAVARLVPAPQPHWSAPDPRARERRRSLRGARPGTSGVACLAGSEEAGDDEPEAEPHREHLGMLLLHTREAWGKKKRTAASGTARSSSGGRVSHGRKSKFPSPTGTGGWEWGSALFTRSQSTRRRAETSPRPRASRSSALLVSMRILFRLETLLALEGRRWQRLAAHQGWPQSARWHASPACQPTMFESCLMPILLARSAPAGWQAFAACRFRTARCRRLRAQLPPSRKCRRTRCWQCRT